MEKLRVFAFRLSLANTSFTSGFGGGPCRYSVEYRGGRGGEEKLMFQQINGSTGQPNLFHYAKELLFQSTIQEYLFQSTTKEYLFQSTTKVPFSVY